MDLAGRTLPEDLKGRLTADFLKKNMCAPIEKKEGTLYVAVEDPYDLTRLDAIKSINLAPRHEFVVALRGDISDYINASFGLTPGSEGDEAGDVRVLIKELEASDAGEEEEVEPETAPTPMAEVDETDSGVVKLCNQIIIDAYNKGASDIHVEPYGKTAPTVIRLRIDGDCHKYLEIPPNHRNAVVQRFKIMSKLDIAEKRKPQDGKIRFRGPMGTIELRVATIPTSGGNEDVVMRILAASKPLPLERMGFSDRNLTEFKTILEKPYGICLVVGPTGSGKTTTLHSGLGYINTVDMKIWTAEDPVEITQAGLRQVQVHPKIEFTFAVAMRAFLRADPDVIMVGEMRDHETAATGIEASLTGPPGLLDAAHQLGAGDDHAPAGHGHRPLQLRGRAAGHHGPAPGAHALQGLQGGVHARRQEEFAELMQEYGLEYWDKLGIRYSPEFKLYRPKGCAKCGNTGYKGRMGIHELLVGDRRDQAQDPEARDDRGAAQAGDARRHDDAAAGRHPEGHQGLHRLQAGARRLHEVAQGPRAGRDPSSEAAQAGPGRREKQGRDRGRT